MNRRQFVCAAAATAALAGCASVEVKVVLPLEVEDFIKDADSVAKKVAALTTATTNTVQVLGVGIKHVVDGLHAGLAPKPLVATLAQLLLEPAQRLPTPYNLAAATVIALMEVWAGTSHPSRASSLPMSVAAARVILRR